MGVRGCPEPCPAHTDQLLHLHPRPSHPRGQAAGPPDALHRLQVPVGVAAHRPGQGPGGGGDTGAPWAARGLAAEAPTHRLAKSTLTLIPLLGVHEVAFAFVTDEHAQGTLRSAKLFFDLFLSSFQVPPCPLEPPAPPQAWLPP